MVLQEPTVQDLTTFSTNETYKEPKEVWNISTPEKNGLYWSILIPYLITSVEIVTFRDNIELLVGENPDKKIQKEKLDFDAIQKRAKTINPFKNYHTLFSDTNLTLLMRILKLRINRIAGNVVKNSESNYMKLEAAATMLMCNIDLYEERSGKKSLKAFTSTSSSKKSQCVKIIIFSQDQASKLVYGFGLTKNYSLDLRVASLKHILKTAGVQSTAIPGIVNLVPCEHFLLALINSPSKHVIPMLYESPYILKKLNDAGFDTNPLTTGQNGFSVFYKCILLNDWRLFQVLYNHASSKDYFTSKDSVEIDILTKLTLIREMIQKEYRSRDLSIFRSESKALRMYNLLMHFNKYHIEIEKGITSIRDKSGEQKSKKLNETMLFIIDKYFEYFHYDAKEDKFEDFLQNYEFHKIVDEFTCLRFFDHFLSLNIKIEERNESVFIEVLASLFLYFLSDLTFQRDVFKEQSETFNAERKANYFIIFCYRMRWYTALSALLKELRSGLQEVKDSSIIKIVEKCLTDYPLIKEEFLLARLQIYLKVAKRADFSRNEIKAALTVLRTLQVMGETFWSTKIGCTVTLLLQYCVPLSVVNGLSYIRHNCLSHFHARCTEGRKKLEQSSFLLNIQQELESVAQVFKPIFEMQMFRAKNFMLAYGLEQSQSLLNRNFNSDLFKKLNDMKTEIADFEQEHFMNNEDKYISIATKMLDLIPQNASSNEIKSFHRLQISCDGLKHLLIFISKHSNNCNIEIFIQEVDKIEKLCLKYKGEKLSENSIKEIIDVFSELKKNFIAEFKIAKKISEEIPFPNLDTIIKIIKDYDVFTPLDQTMIRNRFSEYLETSKQQVIDHINGKTSLKIVDLDNCLKYLTVNKNTRTTIKKSMQTPDKALKLVQGIDCSVDTILGNEEETCSKLMTAINDDKYKTLIPLICLPKHIHDKLYSLKSQKLDFILERMQYLEEILINDNDYIKNLRKYGTSLACREHTKRLLMHRYVTEMDTKAALEMLLLDCLEIFNKRDGFQSLWEKTTNLFQSINIRDILSHGCPILEISNDLLDKENLPMELVNTALELIEDQKALKALIDLSYKTGLQAKDLQYVIKNPVDDMYSDLKKIIEKCGRWERYLFLFSS